MFPPLLPQHYDKNVQALQAAVAQRPFPSPSKGEVQKDLPPSDWRPCMDDPVLGARPVPSQKWCYVQNGCAGSPKSCPFGSRRGGSLPQRNSFYFVFNMIAPFSVFYVAQNLEEAGYDHLQLIQRTERKQSSGECLSQPHWAQADFPRHAPDECPNL